MIKVGKCVVIVWQFAVKDVTIDNFEHVDIMQYLNMYTYKQYSLLDKLRYFRMMIINMK